MDCARFGQCNKRKIWVRNLLRNEDSLADLRSKDDQVIFAVLEVSARMKDVGDARGIEADHGADSVSGTDVRLWTPLTTIYVSVKWSVHHFSSFGGRSQSPSE